VASAQADLVEAQAQHEQANIEAGRYELLYSQGFATQQQAQVARAAERVVAASVVAAERKVDAARGNLTTARANLANPPIRSSQEAAVREQRAAAEDDLRGAQAAVTQAQVQTSQAEAALTTAQALLVNPLLHESQESAARLAVLQARNDLSAAQNTAQEARGRLQEASADRRELVVRAPFTGTITTRLVELGEVVAPGSPVVCMLDLTKLYLRAYVAEGDIGRVKLHQHVRVFLDSAPTASLDATVGRIDPNLSFTPENTYFRNDRVKQVDGVKLYLQQSTGSAKPGMPADAEILVQDTWPAKEPWRR
jgi:HlyD family secretion protein